MAPEREAPVYVLPYDLRWPALFETERALLANALRPWLRGPIEHVGSTAVTGMPAKPVIDIMAGVESPDVMHWFCKPSFAERTHHLHLVPFRSLVWDERLGFRDCLRSDPAVADEYAALKYHLAEIHRLDREAYTDAKGTFIARVLDTLRIRRP